MELALIIIAYVIILSLVFNILNMNEKLSDMYNLVENIDDTMFFMFADRNVGVDKDTKKCDNKKGVKSTKSKK